MFMVLGLGIRVRGLLFRLRMLGLGFRFFCSRFWVLGFRVQYLEFKV